MPIIIAVLLFIAVAVVGTVLSVKGKMPLTLTLALTVIAFILLGPFMVF